MPHSTPWILAPQASEKGSHFLHQKMGFPKTPNQSHSLIIILMVNYPTNDSPTISMQWGWQIFLMVNCWFGATGDLDSWELQKRISTSFPTLGIPTPPNAPNQQRTTVLINKMSFEKTRLFSIQKKPRFSSHVSNEILAISKTILDSKHRKKNDQKILGGFNPIEKY